MSTELRVLVAHLDELAAKQGEAAATIGSATETVNGASASVRSTHGVISASTAAAVDAAQHARRTAGGRMERESRSMQERLKQSAIYYDGTDGEAAGRVGGRITSSGEG